MKKFFSVICAVLLLIPMRVSAANTITFTPPFFLREWSGTSGNFTVPYSAYYKLTLSGAQGSSYGGGEGGLGVTQTKTLWLREGTEVKYQCSPQTQRTMSGDVMNINAGETSKLWFDDVLQATSSGGQGTYASNIAPTGCNSVKLYQGGNDSVATYPVHWHKGNQNTYGDCYTVAIYRHDHNGGCYGHVCDGGCHYVEGHYEWVYNDNDDGEDTDGWHKKWISAHTDHSGNQGLVCGGSPPNTFDHCGLGCGFQQGQIVGIQPQAIGYSDNTWVADEEPVQSNKGAGRFSIQLVEQDRLYYANGTVNSLTYRNSVANLVVYQDPKTNEHYALFVKHTQH